MGASAGQGQWVFGYGSLMWYPGFDYLEAVPATLAGYHRAFCIYSVHYRGTSRRPGLVLGLDRGGQCVGMAFRLDPARAGETLRYLRERELIYGVYREVRLPVLLAREAGAARVVMAMTFVAERVHPAYAGRLRISQQAKIMRGAAGVGGTNLDYLISTMGRLDALGIKEPGLNRLRALSCGAMGRTRPAGSHPLAGCARLRGLQRAWARKAVRVPFVAGARRFCYRAHLKA